MDDLTAQFLRRLQERATALTAAKRDLGSAPGARAHVRMVAHALRGAGGTYGYPEISTAAAAVETAADDALPPRLEALLEIMRRVIAQPRHQDVTPHLGAAPPPAHLLPRASAAAAPGQATMRLLVVDDDPDIAQLLARVLAAPDRRIEIAESAAALERETAEHEYALVVLDLVLPDEDGRTLLGRLRQSPRTAAVPIVVLSALQSDGAREECYALGADAYIEKPFDPRVVAAAVASKLERARHVRPSTDTDPLTALLSRAAFVRAFHTATTTEPQGRPPIAVALFELDQYVTLAASAGWATADRALSLAAQALADALQGAACLAHWSGATLAALLERPETPATALAEAALKAVRGSAAVAPAEHYTFSAGVVEWTPGASLEETIADTERLVHAARAAGGDTVRSASAAGAPTCHVVLVAEDDDLIASVVKHRLTREGMTVRHYPDGLSALEAATRLKPSLAILDVKMPGMDGFELLGRLRAEAALAGMPILMLTSMGSEQDIVRGLDLGADEYMVKPFSPVELVARVRRLLVRR